MVDSFILEVNLMVKVSQLAEHVTMTMRLYRGPKFDKQTLRKIKLSLITRSCPEFMAETKTTKFMAVGRLPLMIETRIPTATRDGNREPTIETKQYIIKPSNYNEMWYLWFFEL